MHEPARRSALSASVMRVGRAQFLQFRVSQCVHVLRATPVFREAGRTRCDHALTVALHFDVIVGAAVALYFDVIVGAVQRHLVAAASRGPPREASSTSLPRLCIEHIVARPTGGQACVAPCVARGCHPDTAGAFAVPLRVAAARVVGVLRVFAIIAARGLANVTANCLNALAVTRKHSLWRVCVRVGTRVAHKLPRNRAKSRGGGGKSGEQPCFHVASIEEVTNRWKATASCNRRLLQLE